MHDLGTWGAVALPYARPLTPGTTTEADERSRSNDDDGRRTNERLGRTNDGNGDDGAAVAPRVPPEEHTEKAFQVPGAGVAASGALMAAWRC